MGLSPKANIYSGRFSSRKGILMVSPGGKCFILFPPNKITLWPFVAVIAVKLINKV